MIDVLKPYAEYKESGVPWLGKIPKHWDVKRFKYLLREMNSRSLDGHEQLLRVSQYTGVTPRLSLNGDTEPDTRAESLVGYKQVASGDLVINIMIAWNGSLGVARSAGIVSPAYCVYRFNNHAEPWYYHNLLRIPLYKGRIKVDSTGVIESRLRLYSDELFRIEGILPGREEQAAIARFVEGFSRRVDRLIRDKRRFIELLNEQKHAIIHQAVTRGLNPNVRLKPSGIEWLGDIPEHWEVMKLKYKVKFYGGGTPSKAVTEYWKGDIPWVSPKDMKKEFVEDSQDHITHEAVEQSSTKLIETGAVLLVVRSGILRRTIPVAINRCTVALNQDMKALVTKAGLTNNYLAAIIRGNQQTLLVEWRKKGATVESIEQELLTNTCIPIPPVQEQQAIVANIDKDLIKVNELIDRAYREIALIREYRTRLISDVVTGKLDVRGVKLPAMDEAETLEDIDTSEDIEAEDLIETEEATDADN